MNTIPLYPLRFDPIFQYRVWGGRRLENWFTAPLPGNEPIGEAWVLSDRDDHPSIVSEGAFKGHTIAQLIEEHPDEMLGDYAGHFSRFPLLLKFLDARDTLSVQVHPSDDKSEYLPPGETGKTEAWVVLETDEKSRVYAGLTKSSTRAVLEEKLEKGVVAESLVSFTPKPGDTILIPAGTVHAMGDVVVFEVQENSDVTFRLHDWDRVDAQTGKRRPLHVAQALECIDYNQHAVEPITPHIEADFPALREQLIDCEHFGLWRLYGQLPFSVGKVDTPRLVVCLAGDGTLDNNGSQYGCGKGDVFLLPAAVGTCLCRPENAMTLLEISLPKAP